MLHSIGIIVTNTFPLQDLGFYLVVVLTYKGNHECENLFSRHWILYFGWGIHIVCYPTTAQTLTPNVRVQNHFLWKTYPKNIWRLSKPMINANIIIKSPHVSHLVCPCFIIAPTCTIVRWITLINNIPCQIKLTILLINMYSKLLDLTYYIRWCNFLSINHIIELTCISDHKNI
jgi:hypothetical protein